MIRVTIGHAAGPAFASAARILSRACSAISLAGRPERGPKPVESFVSQGQLPRAEAAEDRPGVFVFEPSGHRGGTLDGGQVLVKGL